jgi:hypothetical protein
MTSHYARDAVPGSAVDVMTRAEAPITAREIAETLIAGKATRKQAVDLQAAAMLVVLEAERWGW